MYTGGLENRPTLVGRLARARPLWGNRPGVLRLVRSPFRLAQLFDATGVPCPAVRPFGEPDPGKRWLVKPLGGSGGAGIGFLAANTRPRFPRRYYLQEYVEGEPRAAVFVGDGQGAALLGVTRQLVGESCFHARPFRYCGSLGVVGSGEAELAGLERIGRALATAGVRGLFGVDFILRGGVPWPVEVNPRYTASVEVLEEVLGIRALWLHRRVFDPAASEPVGPAAGGRPGSAGKAILFARRSLVFPGEGPWHTAVGGTAGAAGTLFADVPAGGEHVAAGRPVLTLFARAANITACQAALREQARSLDRWLFGG